MIPICDFSNVKEFIPRKWQGFGIQEQTVDYISVTLSPLFKILEFFKEVDKLSIQKQQKFNLTLTFFKALA